VLSGGNIPRAIDEGVTELGAEMVAAATEGSTTGGRLSRSSIAWKTLAHSPVPVLLRHVEYVRDLDEQPPGPVIVTVPLDGSERAEDALALAADLAKQWQGSLLLAHVSSDASEGKAYLDRIAQQQTVPVQIAWTQGHVAEALSRLATDHGVTHVVMT